MHTNRLFSPAWWALGFLIAAALLPDSGAGGINDLSEHFNEPDGDISPWMFIPGSNIREMSTREHPGMMTIWEAGNGQDIKGILREPIRINDYRLPWEFQLAMVQNFSAMLGHGAGDPIMQSASTSR